MNFRHVTTAPTSARVCRTLKSSAAKAAMAMMRAPPSSRARRARAVRRGRARCAPRHPRTQGSCAVRPATCHPTPSALLRHTIADTQLDRIEFGNPVTMQRQKWADDMAMDRSRLHPDAHGVGIYSSHDPPERQQRLHVAGRNAALIAQDDALRAAVA